MSEMSGVYFLSEVRLEEEEEYNNYFRITPECFNELFICSFICSFIIYFFPVCNLIFWLNAFLQSNLVNENMSYFLKIWSNENVAIIG